MSSVDGRSTAQGYRGIVESAEPDEQKERSQLRRERDQWRHLFTQLVEKFPEPMFAVDDDRTIRYFNDAAESAFERSQQEAVGSKGYEFFQTEGESEILAETVARENKTIRETEFRKITTSRGDVWNRAMAVPIEDIDGDVIGSVEMTSIVTDLVEQRQRMATAQETVSREVGTAVEDLRETAEMVADGSTESAQMAATQREQIEQVSAEVAKLSASIEEVAATANEVEETSAEAEELALEGQEAGSQAIDAMESVSESADEMADEVTQLQERIAEIDDIVDVIDGIADQTNMLALNASIEAARAGEAGEGFAVVADEIKSLATESQDNAARIEETIGVVQSTTERTVESIQETATELEAGVEQAQVVLENLSAIVDAVTRTAEGIQDVAEAADDQATSTEAVAGTVDDVTARAEKLADEIETVAEANQEQHETINEIDRSIQDLKETMGEITD